MKVLHFHKTDSTPEILLDAANNSFKIKGESRPENIRKFYEPLFNWFNEYFAFLSLSKTKPTINLEINFEYFNTSTARMIYDLILNVNEKCKTAGGTCKVTWSYDGFDEDVRESGKELQKFTAVHFDFIQIN